MNDGDFNLSLVLTGVARPLPQGDAAGKAFPAEEGFVVLTWDGALAPLLARWQQSPTLSY